jgi:hypothetical protein
MLGWSTFCKRMKKADGAVMSSSVLDEEEEEEKNFLQADKQKGPDGEVQASVDFGPYSRKELAPCLTYL